MIADSDIARILNAKYPYVDSDAPPVEYIPQAGSLDQAVIFSYLFWPETFECRGAVFISLWPNWWEEVTAGILKPIDGAKQISWREAVDSYNWFEFSMLMVLVSPSPEDIDLQVDKLAEVLVQTWGAKLKQDFQEREFAVTYVDDDDTSDPFIKVVQVSPPLLDPPEWNRERRYFTA